MIGSVFRLCSVLTFIIVHLWTGCDAARYDERHIVNDWTECPVQSPTPWHESLFDATLVGLSLDFGAAQPPGAAAAAGCGSLPEALAACASDGDPSADSAAAAAAGVTSLSTTDGCCLAKCAAGLRRAAANGCLQLLVDALCRDGGAAAKHRAGL
ncbi:MAG: hypothetical protein J3K34DRAFT_102529 [Monoraphidium minutum]|nr:MAG: hypothetical protein J3K34DRAFT_102529 [Monoraphidium minutum]